MRTIDSSIKIGEKEIIPSFSNYILIYVENLKEPSEKLFRTIGEGSKMVGYKVNIQKSVSFQRTSKTDRKKKDFNIREYQELENSIKC